MPSFPPPPPPPSSSGGGGYAAKKFPGGPPTMAPGSNTNSKYPPPPPSSTTGMTPRGTTQSSSGAQQQPPLHLRTSTTTNPPPPLQQQQQSKFPPPSPRTNLAGVGGTPTNRNNTNPPLTPSSTTTSTTAATPLAHRSASANSIGHGPASPSPIRPAGFQTPSSNSGTANPKFPPPSPLGGSTGGAPTKKFPPPPQNSSSTTTTTAAKSLPMPTTRSKQPPTSNAAAAQFKKPTPFLKNLNDGNTNNMQQQPPKMMPAKTSAGIGQAITHLKSPNHSSTKPNKSPNTLASSAGGGGSGKNTPRNSSLSSNQFLPSSSADNNDDGETPLVMFAPVSISIAANGHVLRMSLGSSQIESSSLFDVLNSSGNEIGQRYARDAAAVPNALRVSEKEGTTNPDVVCQAVETLGNSSTENNVLSQMLKHMINSGKENPESWPKDIETKYVPILGQVSSGSEQQLPCPRSKNVDDVMKNNNNNNAPDQHQVHDSNNNNDSDYTSQQQKQEASRQLQQLVISGDRARAVQVALDNGLYAEALLTSMLCDKQVYENTVHTFIERNIDRTSPLGQAFMLFNELPLSAPDALNVNHWAHHVKMLLCNYSAAGLAEGVANWSDALLQNGMIDEAHLCLLLLQQSPAWQNPNIVNDSLRNRILLISGVYRKQGCRKAFMNFRSLFLSDVMEYSKQRSINEKFIRPPLIPFKLAHGLLLQELGLLERAGTYFDTVSRILLPGTPKQLLNPKLWDRNATGQVPASLFQVTEICKFTLNQYFKTLEGKSGGTSGSNGASSTSGSSGSGGGGILGWFGIGGGSKNEQQQPKKQDQPQQPQSNNNNVANINQNQQPEREKPPLANNNADLAATARTPTTTTTTTTSSNLNEINNNNENNNLSSTYSSNRSASAPAPQRNNNENKNSTASSQPRSQSRVGAVLSSIGGLFRRNTTKSEDPPPKAMILDSEPVPEWDPVNKCYKRKLTAEEEEIERRTKAGPPKVDPMLKQQQNQQQPMNNIINPNTNGVGPANNNNGIQQPQPNQQRPGPGGAPTGMPGTMKRPGSVPAGGGSRPPGGGPPPPLSRHSAAGRNRYADVFNS